MKRDREKATEKEKEAAWEILWQQIDAGLQADESEFIKVTAEDVIRRNKKKLPK